FKSLNALNGGVVIVIRERQRINRLVRNSIGGGATMYFSDIVVKNKDFADTLKTAQAAASSTSNVLLLGESGTGKDIIAQAMHNASPRRHNPYLAINCAALPRDLIASELFGYEEGAFTGARKGGNIGKFELADQGTIFLDEIGDMPLYLQATLLRVLEEKKVMRLGSSKLIPVDVRIIAATNKDLEIEIEHNRFRRDLFYRLGVIKIDIPPLRNRPEDILELTRVFVEKTCIKFNKPVLEVADEVLEAFTAYDWPGNVRELQNLIEAAVQLCQEEVITVELIEKISAVVLHNQANNEPAKVNDQMEKQIIMEALAQHKYKKKETAEALGISRSTLYRRMKELEIRG
ncbi:MAG: sigma 54-interacting transcriptional regulator, partial [Syntrophomonadaceae bacterium]|nr:sigma 54-interacting transcriptional regulator [Syntrophomonadaceae bacterium]